MPHRAFTKLIKMYQYSISQEVTFKLLHSVDYGQLIEVNKRKNLRFKQIPTHGELQNILQKDVTNKTFLLHNFT